MPSFTSRLAAMAMALLLSAGLAAAQPRALDDGVFETSDAELEMVRDFAFYGDLESAAVEGAIKAYRLIFEQAFRGNEPGFVLDIGVTERNVVGGIAPGEFSRLEANAIIIILKKPYEPSPPFAYRCRSKSGGFIAKSPLYADVQFEGCRRTKTLGADSVGELVLVDKYRISNIGDTYRKSWCYRCNKNPDKTMLIDMFGKAGYDKICTQNPQNGPCPTKLPAQ